MNVRSFPPDKFQNPTTIEAEGDLGLQPAVTVRVQHPVPLCRQRRPSYKLSRRVKPSLPPSGPTSCPSTSRTRAAVTISDACVRTQAASASGFHRSTPPSNTPQRDTSEAERLLAELHSKAVIGKLRDFRECVDVNRAALAVLENNRDPSCAASGRNWRSSRRPRQRGVRGPRTVPATVPENVEGSRLSTEPL